jgi:wyosine [tRNA(Phe)-imidazoG37] synthetase (radical SAM superfamily)
MLIKHGLYLLITLLLKDFNEKPNSIEEFAAFAKKVSKHKANISTYETKIGLIKSLLDVRTLH